MKLDERLFTDASARAGERLLRALTEDVSLPPGCNRVDIATFSVKTGRWTIGEPSFNARTAAGALWQARLMGQAAGLPALYVAISTDATAIANGDTTIASEETTNGLSRAAGTYSNETAQGSIGSTASFRISNTFTYTGSTQKVIAKAGLLTASSAGTLAFATVLTSTGTVNANGDQITIQWTVTV
jgi:hypothetical protein